MILNMCRRTDRHTNEKLQTEDVNVPKNILFFCELWFTQHCWQRLSTCGTQSLVNWSIADVSERLDVVQHITDV